MADIQFPADPKPQSWKWTTATPVMSSQALDGRIFTRRIAAHLWQLEVDFRPMKKTEFAPLITAMERLHGQEGALLLPLPTFAGAAGFVPGNFVRFNNHSKIYRLVSVPNGQDAAAVFTAAGLPTGFTIFPAARSVAGILQPADNFRASLIENEIAEDFDADGLIRLTLNLQERLDT